MKKSMRVATPSFLISWSFAWWSSALWVFTASRGQVTSTLFGNFLVNIQQLRWRCCLNSHPCYGVVLTSSISLYCLVAGSKQYSAAIAFTLALFSHLINHVNIRLQAELEEGENPVPAFQSDGTGKRTETAAPGSPRLPAYRAVFPLSLLSTLGMGFVVHRCIDLLLLIWNPWRWLMCWVVSTWMLFLSIWITAG